LNKQEPSARIQQAALSANRNLIEVYMKAGAAKHELLKALSKAYQINWATRDALEMRLIKGEERAKKLKVSNGTLDSIEGRVASLRSDVSAA
jgi:hypothetical protein